MKFIAFAWICVSAAVAGPRWETNFAENPSAEYDRDRDELPDGWGPGAFRSPAKLTWDRTVAHRGRCSLRISQSRNPSAKEWNEMTGRWICRQRRTVTPGATYTLAAWIKTEGVTGRATARIAWWSDNRWLAESTTEPVTGTSDWRQVAITVEAPANANLAMIYLGLADSEGTAWFDDVSMGVGAELSREFQAVDLVAVSNASFARLVDVGPQELPAGDLVLRGVPFHLISSQENEGKTCVALRGAGRATLSAWAEVDVNRKCDTIYLLHVCSGGRSGSKVGSYEIVYQDDSTATVPLLLGRQIADWQKPAESEESAVGWEASAEAGPVGLSLFPLANPKPEAGIRAIRVLSSAGDGAPILLAITTADGPPLLTERPLLYEFNDTSGWYPFNFPLDDTNLDSIDLTGFLDPPAGKHGFVEVGRDGHFYFADGVRARFFGTNVGGSGAFPDKDDANVIAARLAKYGVNLLRIHAIDGRWAPLIDYARGDSRQFNEEMLDRLDFFFAELKKRGTYVYFDMLDYRRFMEADGVKDAPLLEHGWHHSIKGASCFNDRMIELQKEFAEKFFTHRNPYTGLRYVDDPAVAVVEITNENSVFYFSNTTLTLPCYVDELESRWNRWLLDRYGSRRGLAEAWTNADGQCALLAEEHPARSSVVLPMKWLYQDPVDAAYVGERSPARVNAMVRFFVGLQRRYYGRMREHLKRIGIRVPITGTNQTFCPASNYADAVNDFMSRNNYWCHPNVHAKPFFTFRNLAMVRSEIPRVSNPVAEVASSTVAGKPMIVPEFNFPWPIEYRAEGLLVMTAYACLQDWDGLLFFTYNPDRKTLEWFGNQSDPVRWGEYPAAALMFHRQDAAAARNTVHVAYSESDVFTARPSHGRADSSPYRYVPYVSKVRNYYFQETYAGDADVVVVPHGAPAERFAKARRVVSLADRAHRRRGAAVGEKVDPIGDYRLFAESAKKWGLLDYDDFANLEQRYASDTGQLCLDRGRGVFTIDTPRTKGAVGFVGEAGPIDLGGWTLDCATPFAAVVATSLDGRPLGESGHLLVTAVARAENTGQAFYQGKRSVPQRGRLPVIAEPVRGELAIQVPGPTIVYPLDETGKRRSRLATSFDSGTLEMRLEESKSPWCEVVVE
jgi:hypothetical protein